MEAKAYLTATFSSNTYSTAGKKKITLASSCSDLYDKFHSVLSETDYCIARML